MMPDPEISPSEEEWNKTSEQVLHAIREIKRRRGALTERCPLMASSSVTSYWSQATLAALPSEGHGSGLWTSVRPGIKEIWSNLTYALTPGNHKAVKIFLLETSNENKRRFVGPTFHTPQEAQQFCIDSISAWPGDQGKLDLSHVRSEGLLKAWSKVWSSEVEACVRTSAESAERFVENFNTTSSLHVRVPKTFVDQLIAQMHKEEIKPKNSKYDTMGRGYFFPEEPPENSDGTEMPDTPIHRRVYGFTSIVVSTWNAGDITKYAFLRSRIKGDQYFVAVTPDYQFEAVDELKAYFSENSDPYPTFDFDAKWMLEDILKTMPDSA